MFNPHDLYMSLVANMLEFADTGRMAREALSYFETPREYTYIYNTGKVPYTIYQEKGFTHYISKKFIDKNKGFISVKGEGIVERYVYSSILGLPYNDLQENQTFIERSHLMMVEIGAVKDV